LRKGAPGANYDKVLPLFNDEVCNPDRLTTLVRRVDPLALDRITRCYGDRLLAAGRRHCRTGDEAEDAVQDALVIAATHLGSFRGEGSLEGWLVRIVASACRRMSRGRKNAAELHDDVVERLASPSSPESEAGAHELGDALSAALLELDPEDRLIVLLSEVDGFDAPEVAERVGLSPGAVRTRLTRIRGRLRAALLPFLTEPESGP
jgi:RNA polymerase sigma factor (sigma-70 family)